MRQTKKSRASRKTGISVKPSLWIVCKDGRAKPITAGRVTVRPEAGGRISWIGKGRAGMISKFQFNVPPGRYVIDVEAKGFKSCRDAVTVIGSEPTLKEVLLRPVDEADED